MMNRKILIIGLVIILVLVIVGFIWFKYKNNSVNNPIDSGKTDLPLSPEVAQEQSKKLQTTMQDLQKVLDDKQKTDLDLDGLSDVIETQLGTNPKNIDTDGDGLTDYDEVKIYQTSPLKADTDGDSYGDGAELRRGYDPLGPGKLKK